MSLESELYELEKEHSSGGKARRFLYGSLMARLGMYRVMFTSAVTMTIGAITGSTLAPIVVIGYMGLKSFQKSRLKTKGLDINFKKLFLESLVIGLIISVPMAKGGFGLINIGDAIMALAMWVQVFRGRHSKVREGLRVAYLSTKED